MPKTTWDQRDRYANPGLEKRSNAAPSIAATPWGRDYGRGNVAPGPFAVTDSSGSDADVGATRVAELDDVEATVGVEVDDRARAVRGRAAHDPVVGRRRAHD